MRIRLWLLLVPALVWAGEKKSEKPKRLPAGEIEIPDPGTAIEDSSVARQEVSRFAREWKQARMQEERVKLLERLGRFDHPEILKAAAKLTKHKDHLVAIAAVVAVARQSKSKGKAAKTLLSCLKREKRTNVVCALLVGLGKLGDDSKAAVKAAKKYFRRDTKETHKAATRYFGYVKYKPAFRMLAEKLDEPAPKSPNDPNNPPASWWKARWHEWDSNVKHTRWALSQLVEGETFESTAEAKQWAEAEGRAYGIEW